MGVGVAFPSAIDPCHRRCSSIATPAPRAGWSPASRRCSRPRARAYPHRVSRNPDSRSSRAARGRTRHSMPRSTRRSARRTGHAHSRRARAPRDALLRVVRQCGRGSARLRAVAVAARDETVPPGCSRSPTCRRRRRAPFARRSTPTASACCRRRRCSKAAGVRWPMRRRRPPTFETLWSPARRCRTTTTTRPARSGCTHSRASALRPACASTSSRARRLCRHPGGDPTLRDGVRADPDAAAVVCRGRRDPRAIARESAGHSRPVGCRPRPAARMHAPTFVVDTRVRTTGSVAGLRRGRPRDDDAGAGGVCARRHTRFAGRVLLQLVYTIWFPERPPAWPGDILAGRSTA